ncbi:hypothetical protein NDN08_004240 [Rhodosorus marinus]|uniref:Phosphate transporter n=1 Tax=Rhodosorus marinus TaxID=101924 RepID=A0AAV8UPX0_9RHOD|nr:hypothetical protein NDN08_004240 [Rhodosorus marinus]
MSATEVVTIAPNVAAQVLGPFTWIFAVALFATMWQSAAMGANDVGNLFGTSVGSRVLTVRMACILASVFITLGAMALGGQVTKTVGKGIVSWTDFQEIPSLYMLGMLTSALAAGMFVSVATWLSMPVSTTHAIVGATIGFGLVELGASGIQWWPGVGKIAISWVISPLLAGVFASAFYLTAKYWICIPFRDTHESDPEWRPVALHRQHIYTAAVWFLVTFTTVMFVITTVRHGLYDDYWYGPAAGIAVGCGALVGIVGYLWAIGLTNRKLDRMDLSGGFVEEENQQFLDELIEDNLLEELSLDEENGAKIGRLSSMRTVTDEAKLSRMGRTVTIDRVKQSRKKSPITKFFKGLTKFIGGEGNKKDVSLYKPDDLWDFQIEKRFAGGQVLSACYMSFAAGANDISNAAGTLQAIYQTLNSGALVETPQPVYWALFYCCVFIIVGLYFFGAKVMKTIGENLTVVTPLRGQSAQLAVAFTVLIASYVGIPVSSTHCLIGAVIAIGLYEPDGFKKSNWGLIGKIGLSWIITLPISGGISALLYAAIRGTVIEAMPFYPPTEPYQVSCDAFYQNATCTYTFTPVEA